MLGKSYSYSSPKHGEKRILFCLTLSLVFIYSITVRGIFKCLLQEERFSYHKLIIISLFIVWGIEYRIKYQGEHFKFCMCDKIIFFVDAKKEKSLWREFKNSSIYSKNSHFCTLYSKFKTICLQLHILINFSYGRTSVLSTKKKMAA